MFLQVSKTLEWKEREHDNNDIMDLGNQGIIYALRDYGLLNFFLCLSVRAQPLLLERLISMWETIF